MADLPSFISTLAVPVTTITCSVGVCQCHGMRQPAEPFASNTDAPFDGSPLCTAAVAHDGNPGIAVKVFWDIFFNVPISSAEATEKQASAIMANLIVFS